MQTLLSYCLISKKLVTTLLFAVYFSLFDIKHTVSTWLVRGNMSTATPAAGV